jgi:chaperonin GroEL (HSP60 family)
MRAAAALRTVLHCAHVGSVAGIAAPLARNTNDVERHRARRILARSIEEPLRHIVGNAGKDAAVMLNQVMGGMGGMDI